MKIYVQKYQSGGGLPPLIDYTVVPPVSSRNAYYEDDEDSSSKSKSSSKDSDDLGIKDIFNLLKDLKGLPSDVNEIQYLIQDLLSPQTSMFGSAASTASQYANLLGTINRIKFSSEAFDNEKKRITDHTDGLNSIAVDGAGNVLVRTKNGEALMSPEEALQAINKGLAMPITNKDLLLNRAYNDAFDDTIYSITANAVGPKDIQERIDEYIKNLGSIENLFGGYSRVENNKVIEGIGILEKLSKEELEAVKVGGLFKIDTLTKDQKANAMLALDYIWRSLPTNAKTYLKFISGGTEQEAKLSVLEFITSKTQSQFRWEATLTKDKEGNITTGIGAAAGTKKYNLAELFFRGYGENITYHLSNGTVSGILVEATSMPIDIDDKITQTGATLFDLATNSSYAALFTDATGSASDNIFIGDQHIDLNSLDKVLIFGNANQIDLPIAMDLNGRIHPDMDMLNKLEKARKEIIDLKITQDDYNRINAIYNKYALPFKYTSTGELNTSNWRTFIVVRGQALDSALTESKFSELNADDFIKELQGNEKDNAFDVFKKNKIKIDKSGLFNSRKDHIYEGNIFIPMTISGANAGAGNTGQLPTAGQALQQNINDQFINHLINTKVTVREASE